MRSTCQAAILLYGQYSAENDRSLSGYRIVAIEFHVHNKFLTLSWYKLEVLTLTMQHRLRPLLQLTG
jgi:hypothetical protein